MGATAAEGVADGYDFDEFAGVGDAAALPDGAVRR